MREKGQVVVILLLILVVALAISLSLIGRSTTEIATSTKSENSSRAFSAAEAGLEKALVGTGTTLNVSLSNQAAADVKIDRDQPPARMALEYPARAKDTIAHFWLANPSSEDANGFPTLYYNQDSFDLYFGDPNSGTLPPEEKPAVEVIYLSYDGANFQLRRYFFDSASPPRGSFNPCGVSPAPAIDTPFGTNRSFYCKVTVAPGDRTANRRPILARIRLLYSNGTHPVALKPFIAGCAAPYTECSLPPQAAIFRSEGQSSDVKRVLQIFQQKDVINPIFDYVLYSAGDLKK